MTKKLCLKDRRGQGMTEYIIIVALIAIAAIGVITTFGDDIRRIFEASTQSLSGSPNVKSQAKAAQYHDATLQDFGANNKGE